MKSDLERLYLVERLSAAKIARAYRLEYSNPKTAESTILYHLKRNGIERRDRSEHVRKVGQEMVTEWAKRYAGGESLKKIAGDDVSPVTVFLHLRARGLPLRDKVEAQIQAATKYPRRPFDGNNIERAYLLGLRYGDLHVVRHGRAVRVRVSTTHPAMAELFETLFSPYGHVHRYARRAKLTGFEWSLECDLDISFRFLLSRCTVEEIEAFSTQEFLSFLAGLFDAEGSIYLHNKRGRHNPEVFVANTDADLVDVIATRLRALGLNPKVVWLDQRIVRGGITGESKVGRVIFWRFHDVQALIRAMPLRHSEKVAKSSLVLGMKYRSTDTEDLASLRSWEDFIARIKTDRDRFVRSASLRDG